MTPSRISTPPAPAPAEPHPEDIAWLVRNWKRLGGFAAALASAGFIVISPLEQVKQLRLGHDAFVMSQRVRDSVQDLRLSEVRDTLRNELRQFRENQNNQMIVECLRAPNTFARVKLQCTDRLKGER